MSASDARAATLLQALQRRAPLWRAALARAQSLRRGADDVDAPARLIADYRLLARDLASARRLAPHSRMRAALEAAYAQAHATLYHDAVQPVQALVRIGRDALPAAVAALTPYIVWIALLLALSVFAGHWLVRTQPELIALFASPNLIATVELGELWTHDLLNVVPSSVLSIQILTNNIVVSVFAFCAGVLFGLGTLYIVSLNGLMLGAIFAFTGQHGLDGELFRFIVAHGCVELSCMVLSGAAGAALGSALVRPGGRARFTALRSAAASGGLVLGACVLLLLGAGLIEGYVSPRADLGLAWRIAIGVGYWLLMLALLRGWLFRAARP